MAPNPDAQQLVIRTVYEKSGIDPRSVGYIEAHGTGTALGDPSEVRALTGAFERFTSEKGFCAIASVKANIGHLLSAAGAAGVLRAVLTLRKGELAPSAELQVENHLIGFDQTPFKPVRELRPWPRLSYPRRAAVNSFGFGGTNCHLLLEEAPSSIPTGSLLGSADRVLLRVSAHSQSALLARRRDTADWLERYPEHDIADVCYSINQSSTAFPVRCSIVASDRAGLLESLRSRPAKEFPRVERKPRVALLLTGQGSQYPHMARVLYRTCSPFRRYFDEVAGVFDRVLPEPLTETVFGERATVESMAATLITQLSVFAVDYSLGHMLLDFGLEPAFVLGHSVGEYAAACLADVFDLSTCAQALIARASGMQALPSDGGMAAVFAKELQVDQLIDATGGAVCVAGYNGSHQVVSGALNDIEEFARRAAEVGITVRRLTVSHAFHSPLMRPMLDNFARALAGLQCALPRIPLISNVSAQPLTAEPGVQYWLDHVLSPVRFAESIRYARSEGVSVFVEAGPDRVLSTMAQAALSDASDGATFISLLGRKSNDWKAVLEGLGRLHEAGVDLEWNAVEGRSARVLVDVPTYPFERKEFSPLPRPNPLAEVFYRWSWKEFEPDTASGDDSDVLPDGPILCISEALQHAELLRAAMDTRGVQVAHISARQATPSLLRAVSSVQAGTPAACIFWLPAHDGPIGEVNACSTPDLDAERSRQDDIANILLLAKALDSLAPHGRLLRYLVVTQGADGFEEGTASDTNAKHLQTCGCARDAWVSAAWAAVAAISKDSLKLEACAFDLGCTNANDPCLPDVAPVVRALFSKRPNPPLVAAHGSRRYVRKLEPIMLGELGNQGELGKDDTILITGGLGGVGLAIAETLADRFQVNLVLTGRTPVDQSKPTGQGAPEPSTSENDQRLAQLRRLRSLGSRVRYESVDVCDANAMAALTHSVAEEIGPLTGVVHAAGTVDYSTPRLRDKTEEGIRHVLSSKISGSLVLDHVTRDQPLRFFVLFSSIAASSPEWGGGLADYAAANGFLGGLARMRKLWGRSGLSMAMHWSLWNDVGMGRDAGLQSLVRAQGLAPLSKRVALECFHHLIGLGDALPVVHILVRTPEPTRVEVLTTKSKPPAILPLTVTAARNVAVERQQLSAAELVRSCLTEVLERNIERIDLGTGFRELGLTSYSAVAMATRLSERMGRTLNPTLLFEHRNPTALIQFVDEQLRGEDGATPQPLARGCSVPPPGPGNDAVAIISAACRLPGADNVEEYWELLTKGETMIDEVKDQALLTNYFEAGETDAAKTYSKWAAHIRDPMLFDAMFFGISPREAAAMDPQQRLFLEVAWEALQSGGYGGVRPRDVGVFVGCEANHYSERFVNHQRYESLMSRLQDEPWFMRLGASERHALECLIVDVLRPSPVVSDVVAGAGLNEIAARVSHTFDLVGPSFVVNSACSSALVALHLACASLRAGECSMAIVGGVYLNLGSTPFVFLSKLKALSPTGRCRPFDDAADGMVLGEGVGAVLLKPLTRALRDGDTIQAIIRGSALNNDGRSQGITVPNPRGQAAAIRRAYEVSGIAPQTISYVECHGTGTSLGDPIEIEGLTQAFQSFTQERQFCAVGSAAHARRIWLSWPHQGRVVDEASASARKSLPQSVQQSHRFRLDTVSPATKVRSAVVAATGVETRGTKRIRVRRHERSRHHRGAAGKSNRSRSDGALASDPKRTQ